MEVSNSTNEHLEWRMASLENQFKELKESTNKELTMLRQLIKVTWRSILEERQAFWEKEGIPKANKTHITTVSPINNEILLENMRQLELLPVLEEELQSVLRRLSLCETQINRCFQRCQSVVIDTNFNPSVLMDQQDIRTGLMVDNKINSLAITIPKERTSQLKIDEESNGLSSLFVSSFDGKTQSNLHRLE